MTKQRLTRMQRLERINREFGRQDEKNVYVQEFKLAEPDEPHKKGVCAAVQEAIALNTNRLCVVKSCSLYVTRSFDMVDMDKEASSMSDLAIELAEAEAKHDHMGALGIIERKVVDSMLITAEALLGLDEDE